jgi:toxin ParE1/3/4
VSYRLVGHADDRIDALLLESARAWGIEGAARYNRLLLAAMDAVGGTPAMVGSQPLADLPGVRSLHLRLARRLVAREHRVGQPRHLIVYRIAPDGVVEILSVVHDRQQLARAARRAQRDADR